MCLCVLTSVICSEHQLVQFRRYALVEIDLNPLGNRYNRVQYRLVHRVNKRPTMVPHSHPLSDPGALLWHETLFSYSPKRPAVMLQQLPDYSCTQSSGYNNETGTNAIFFINKNGREKKFTNENYDKLENKRVWNVLFLYHFILYDKHYPKFTQKNKYVVASVYAHVHMLVVCAQAHTFTFTFTLYIRQTTYGNDQNYNIKVFSPEMKE